MRKHSKVHCWSIVSVRMRQNVHDQSTMEEGECVSINQSVSSDSPSPAPPYSYERGGDVELVVPEAISFTISTLNRYDEVGVGRSPRLPNKPMWLWLPREVAILLRSIPDCKAYADTFEEYQFDGKSVLLLTPSTCRRPPLSMRKWRACRFLKPLRWYCRLRQRRWLRAEDWPLLRF